MSWLQRHIPEHAQCVAVDMTVNEAVIAVMGPNARNVLQPVIDQSLENTEFGFGQARQVHIGQAVARAHRVSYVGELGWELYVSSELAEHVFDGLCQARITGCPAGFCMFWTAAVLKKPSVISEGYFR